MSVDPLFLITLNSFINYHRLNPIPLKKNITLLISLFLIFFFFTGCGKSYFFSEVTPIAKQTWTYANIPEFEVNIEDINAKYNLLLDITHHTDFRYQNIYIKFYAIDPTGQEAVTQIPVDFANKGGVWFGDCNDEWCHLEGFLQKGIEFSEAGKYIFKLEQYMRIEHLEGIQSIGCLLYTSDAADE